MGLDPSVIGVSTPPTEFSWSERDVMLYAVAVGAGSAEPTAELNLTTENTAGQALAVLPTFANIITRITRAPVGEVDMTKLVHASQAMELHRPIPTSGRALVTATVVEMLDKGSAGVVTQKQVAVDAEDGRPIATTWQTVLIRGAGGFGGERGATKRVTIPEREADFVRTASVRPEQALLYRLTGDRNPLHSDPAFAARGGFDKPILHGMCTYGFTGRLLVENFAAREPSRMRWMEGRFTRPVVPPAQLTVEMWVEDGAVLFRTSADGGVVIDAGRAVFAND
ncbi:MaoC/PaaZ C-terminal domain-containing protein [Actinomadura physcomitrii]|uniref:MaoC/PaaZ C-terminal domain-containing protein n=1 Tax=Actinomadura physcomitrii TaxID=2650748 RepID=UPI002E261EC3